MLTATAWTHELTCGNFWSGSPRAEPIRRRSRRMFATSLPATCTHVPSRGTGASCREPPVSGREAPPPNADILRDSDATIEDTVGNSTIMFPSSPPAFSVPGRPPPGKNPLRALPATLPWPLRCPRVILQSFALPAPPGRELAFAPPTLGLGPSALSSLPADHRPPQSALRFACPEQRPSERGVPAPRNSAEHVTPAVKIPEPRSAPQITDAADPSPQP